MSLSGAYGWIDQFPLTLPLLLVYAECWTDPSYQEYQRVLRLDRLSSMSELDCYSLDSARGTALPRFILRNYPESLSVGVTRITG